MCRASWSLAGRRGARAGSRHAELSGCDEPKVDNFILFVDQSGSMYQTHAEAGEVKELLVKRTPRSDERAHPAALLQGRALSVRALRRGEVDGAVPPQLDATRISWIPDSQPVAYGSRRWAAAFGSERGGRRPQRQDRGHRLLGRWTEYGRATPSRRRRSWCARTRASVCTWCPSPTPAAVVRSTKRWRRSRLSAARSMRPSSLATPPRCSSSCATSSAPAVRPSLAEAAELTRRRGGTCVRRVPPESHYAGLSGGSTAGAAAVASAIRVRARSRSARSALPDHDFARAP